MNNLSVEEFCQHIERTVDIGRTQLPTEYFYSSLSLCIIDSVFSIGIKYNQVEKVVDHYCTWSNLEKLRSSEHSTERHASESVSDFISRLRGMSSEDAANLIFKNRTRTSSTSGILKAEAVLEFAKILQEFKVDDWRDVAGMFSNPLIEQAIRNIRGQRSGISFKYFCMLAGSDNLIKPDRMIKRYCENFWRKDVAEKMSDDQAVELIQSASRKLSKNYPAITPRLLDYLIWDYQRSHK
jgi:hypothetical protein